MRTNLKKIENPISARKTVLGGALALIAAIGFSTQLAAQCPTSANVSVFATGLNNPRGLKFGSDGNLYVAEGGIGGSNSTAGTCEQNPPPVGPYTGSATGGRISKIDANGVRTTVVDDLPSSQTSPDSGSLISGVSDVAFIGDRLYALLAGAGCSHGVPSVPNGVVRVNANGTVDLVADLSAYQIANPVANPDEDDFDPDGTWYSMIAVRGDLYAVNPNHQELVRISPTTGEVRRVVDISVNYPGNTNWVGPTAIASHGNFYVGTLNPFPIVEGSSKILKITPSGNIKVAAEGLTTVLGVAFDQRARMYVLENTTNPPGNTDPLFPTPCTGQVVRINHSGKKTVIASGLFLPTAMTFGPDGALYVSNIGFGPPPVGLGQVVRITMP
jgi:glucose/arabinose dehydrogenase